MNPQSTPAQDTANGDSTLHDLFALSDEQILEIEPEAPSVGQPLLAVQEESASAPLQKPEPDAPERVSQARIPEQPTKDAQAGVPAPLEPPKWLAERMNDPWNGEEARQFWQGIQREREESAAYRGVFAKPEDARAASERSRQLDAIDQLYFGAAGKPPEESAAAREQLAQILLREDPAAFREMVAAGLRALERASSTPAAQAGVAQALRPEGVPIGGTVSSTEPKSLAPKGASYSADHRESTIAAYAAFEKAANQDLEREVGGSIARVLEQALPVAQPLLAVRSDRATGAQAGVPVLHERLSAAIRADIESALKSDRQLGESVARLLASRQFTDATRAQVVRLIGERARQLVPGAAKRVLQEWTHTALAAHRGRAERADAAASRRGVEPASAVPGSARAPSRPPKPIDYRKLSDEQILNM